MWRRLDDLIDRAAGPADIASHRLELLAAQRYRSTGRAVPPAFVEAERFAALASMTAPILLKQIASVLDDEAVVIKGLEVAAYYPDASLRSFGDVDLLVREPEAAQRALLEAGFEEVGDPAIFVGIHHLRPLRPRGMVVPVEIHFEPKWIEGRRVPPVAELFERAIPSASGVPRMLTLEPAAHALILAAHSWAHEPLRRLRDLVDIAAVASRAEPGEIDRLARAWDVERLWRTTDAVLRSLFAGGSRPRVLQIWAQNLRLVRERTVLEAHAERWLSDFWALPPGTAVRRLPQTVRGELGPDGDEGWPAKVARTRLALRNAARRRSHHDHEWQTRHAERSESSD